MPGAISHGALVATRGGMILAANTRLYRRYWVFVSAGFLTQEQGWDREVLRVMLERGLTGSPHGRTASGADRRYLFV